MNKLITFFSIIIFISGCKEEPKKEKFSYKRVQENTETTVVKSVNDVTINSTDQMLFDRSVKLQFINSKKNRLFNLF